jgi:hypothetical protein
VARRLSHGWRQIDYSYDDVRHVLVQADHWCDILSLHLLQTAGMPMPVGSIPSIPASIPAPIPASIPAAFVTLIAAVISLIMSVATPLAFRSIVRIRGPNASPQGG